MTEPKVSRHHLFTRSEIKAKLIDIFGTPTTAKEQRNLAAKVRRIHMMMPTFLIDHKLHKRLHNIGGSDE